jgi:integrase
VSVNAAAGQELPALDQDDEWTYLDQEEQRRLLACPEIPHADRLIMAFAIGTGLRQGEQWNLELKDLHLKAFLLGLLKDAGVEIDPADLDE